MKSESEMFHLKIYGRRAIDRIQIYGQWLTRHQPVLPFKKEVFPWIVTVPRRNMSRTLTSPSSLPTHAENLTTRTNELSISLAQSINARAPLDDALKKLQALVPEVVRLRGLVDGREPTNGLIGRFGYAQDTEDDEHAVRTRLGVVGRVGDVFGTSERVGGKVRLLDGRVGRVREAVERVGEVMEFKVSCRTSGASEVSGRVGRRSQVGKSCQGKLLGSLFEKSSDIEQRRQRIQGSCKAKKS